MRQRSVAVGRARHSVLHIVGQYPSLTETFIAQYIRHLSAFDQVVLSMKHAGGADGLQPGLPAAYAVEDIWRRWTLSWLLGRVDARLLRRPPYLLYVQSILARHRIRVLHAHFGPQGVWALPVKRASQLPLVTTFYGYDMSMLPRRGSWLREYCTLFAQGDMFLVEGPHMAQGLMSLGCPAEKIEIQHIAIDLDAIPFMPRRLEAGERVRVLFCGRFAEKKGLPYALRAFARVASEYPNIEMRVIGDGPLRAVIEQMVAELGIQGQVYLLGYQPYARFTEELQQAHIFLMPSVTAEDGDSEGGAPTVLLEAQASGLPVVATYHADIPYVVSEGQSALLAPERDVEALAAHILHLVRNPHCWPEMGRAGRRRVAERHDIRVEACTLEEKYGRLLSWCS